MRFILSISIIFYTTHSIAQTERYASPNGTGNGLSYNNPTDLQTGLNSLQPGDTLWLLNGQYDGRYSVSYSGTDKSPITIQSYPEEWAILNGNVASSANAVLHVSGAYNIFRDFEITFIGDFERDESEPNFQVVNGVYHLGGYNCKFINLKIHDNPGSGFGSWKFKGASEMYGNVIYNNGYQGDTRGHGVGFYVQNIGEDIRLFKNNIVFNNFYKGFELWSAERHPTTDHIKNIDLINNTVFNSGSPALPFESKGTDNIFLGSKDSLSINRPKSINIKDNILYHNTDLTYKGSVGEGNSLRIGWNLGFTNAYPENIVVHNNLIIGRNNTFIINPTVTLNLTNNIIFGRNIYVNDDTNLNLVNTSNWTLEGNTYYTRGYPGEGHFSTNFIGNVLFLDWKNLTGLDGTSDRFSRPTFTNEEIQITQNYYDTSLFKIVILNFGGTASSIDFSNYFTGNTENYNYTVRDVENLDIVHSSGTIDPSTILSVSISLTLSFKNLLIFFLLQHLKQTIILEYF